MDLQRSSVEYAHVTFSNLPNGSTVAASIDLQTWQTATITGNECLVLLRGPDATSTDGLLISQKTELWVRITANPEIIVRSAGWIDLY